MGVEKKESCFYFIYFFGGCVDPRTLDLTRVTQSKVCSFLALSLPSILLHSSAAAASWSDRSCDTAPLRRRLEKQIL